MKTCKNCGKRKPASEFYRRGDTHDGLTSDCKACRNARSKQWRQDNPERQAELVRSWQQRNRPRFRQLGRQWYARHAERVRPVKLERGRRWRWACRRGESVRTR